LLAKNQIPISYLNPESADSMCKNLEKSLNFPQEMQEEIILEAKQLSNENFLNEIEFIEAKIPHKPRYPLLAIDTKPTENADISDKLTDFFKENLKENRKKIMNLKDRKGEFIEFLNGLGWKSKSYLNKNEGNRGFVKDFEYIRDLNSNLCNFQQFDLNLKKSIESFRENEKNEVFERKKKGVSEIERRWKEEMKVLKEGKKGKEGLDYDLEFLLKNRKNNKSLY